jgi:hypothetical protein
MAHHGFLEENSLKGRSRGEHRRHDHRAVSGTLTTGGIETFTGVSSMNSNSLLFTNSQKPTTQTRPSSTSISNSTSLLTMSAPSASYDSPLPTNTSATQSPTPGSEDAGGFFNNHKLLLSSMVAGFLALVLVVCIVVCLLVRRTRRRRVDEVARQSFAAGDVLNLSKDAGKEAIPMGETSQFNRHHRKKGSRDDGWRGLPSQDDNHGPSGVANDGASVRTGGLRSRYVPPADPSFGTLPHDPLPTDTSRPTLAPPYALTGAFENAFSTEDDEERDQSTSQHSHHIVARIERGPQMRVPQAQSHPHPYADPSLMSSSATTEQAPSYRSHSPSAQRYQQSAAWVDRRDGGSVEPAGGSRPGDFLSFTPSSATPSAPTASAPEGRDSVDDPAHRDSSIQDAPPSPSSMYSERSAIPRGDGPTVPGPVVSPLSHAPLASPASFLNPTSPNPSRNGGAIPRASGKQTKQERAMNVRALNDLIDALDSVRPPTSSDMRPGMNDQGSRSIPDAGMWRAALGVRRDGDSSSSSRK